MTSDELRSLSDEELELLLSRLKAVKTVSMNTLAARAKHHESMAKAIWLRGLPPEQQRRAGEEYMKAMMLGRPFDVPSPN